MRVQHESEMTGEASLRFIRAGNKPDDAMHAVNFGFVISRLALGEPLIGNHSDAVILQQVLGGSSDVSGTAFPTPQSWAG